MLPRALLSFGIHRGEVAPDFLGAHDHPWVRELMGEFSRLVGQPERSLDERLQAPLRRNPARGKLRMVTHVLRRLAARGVGDRTRPRPAEVRQALFRAATAVRREGVSSLSDLAERARAAAALSLSPSPDDPEARAWADLRGVRPLGPLPAELTPVSVAEATNLALARGLLARAVALRIVVADDVRRVVRYARLRGLICGISSAGAGGVRLEISGPMSLFRRTRLYGRALADLLGQLARSSEWTLEADLELGADGGPLRLELSGVDRLLSDPGEPRLDSEVERRFEADFARAYPAWDVRREPPPLQVGDRLVFPDFELRHRTLRDRRLLVELVGFWTPEYLARKLASLRRLQRSDLLIFVDERRGCAEEWSELPGPVMAYRNRVDVRDLAPYLEAAAVRRGEAS